MVTLTRFNPLLSDSLLFFSYKVHQCKQKYPSRLALITFIAIVPLRFAILFCFPYLWTEHANKLINFNSNPFYLCWNVNQKRKKAIKIAQHPFQCSPFFIFISICLCFSFFFFSFFLCHSFFILFGIRKRPSSLQFSLRLNVSSSVWLCVYFDFLFVEREEKVKREGKVLE